MQRTIKFRAWSEDTSEMIPWEEAMFLEWLEDATIIVQQYIGLKDKNGKEIYEGEIIKVIFADGSTSKMLVQWNEDGARFNLVDDTWWSFTKDNDMEVTGNIYENPLEVTK